MWEYVFQPGIGVGVESIVKTSLNSKVKIQPSVRMLMLSGGDAIWWEENDLVHVYDVCMQYESVDGSSCHCHVQCQEDDYHCNSSKSKQEQQTNVAVVTYLAVEVIQC